MKNSKSHLQTLIYAVTLSLLLIDSYRSGNASAKYFHLDSRYLALTIIVFLTSLRFFSPLTLNPFLQKLNTLVIFPLTSFFAATLTIYNVLTSTNYVFSLTGIQYPQILVIALFTGSIWLLNHDNPWFTKHYPRLIFFGSITYFLVSFLTSHFPFDFFTKLSYEDSLIENTQVIVLLFSVYFSLKVSWRLYKHDKLNSAIFLFISLTLFFIAGDEISWGQRLFHIVTPEVLIESNSQKEITFHNLYSVVDYLKVIYILIGIYGATTWIFQRFLPFLQKKPFLYFIPPSSTSLFFISTTIYNSLALTGSKYHVSNWAESVELMLYLGVLFTLITLFIRLKQKSL